MSDVPACEVMTRKPTSISAEPSSVNRMNFTEAGPRASPPQIAMRKYIGISTTSKNTKNTIRSSATNVPRTPTSSTSISASSCRTLPGSGTVPTV